MTEDEDPTLLALRLASQDLLFSSESDRPITSFLWPKSDVGAAAMDEATLRRFRGIDPALAILTVSVADFFAPMSAPQPWHDEEEKAIAARFATLATLLGTLGGVCAYRVGAGPEIDVYVVGTTISGDFAGVQTQLTET